MVIVICIAVAFIFFFIGLFCGFSSDPLSSFPSIYPSFDTVKTDMLEVYDLRHQLMIERGRRTINNSICCEHYRCNKGKTPKLDEAFVKFRKEIQSSTDEFGKRLDINS